MKYAFIIGGLVLSVYVSAQAASPLFTWDLLWAGSWEESKTFQNRGDLRFGFAGPGLVLRGQAIDRRPLNFTLEQPWGEPVNPAGTASFGLYHKTSGSRLLYGILDEWGLPARIRSPWIRSAPYIENHKPVIADLKTVASSTKAPELYLYLSSPQAEVSSSRFEASFRGFAQMQSPVSGFTPAYSAGIEGALNEKYSLMLEGFYTGAELSAKQSSSWFSDPPPLPARDFRVTAAAMVFTMPFFCFSADWAWSDTFALGRGVYGNAGIRFNPPPSLAAGWDAQKPGRWSFSIAADGMGEHFSGRDGGNPGSGFRAAGKAEWKGTHGSFFKANTTLRSPAAGEKFNRSSSGVYYRFPSAFTGDFPLRVSRISLNADRNASNLNKITDDADIALGLSLKLPPLMLPSFFLPASSPKNPKPKSYPLGISLTGSIKSLGSADESPMPYPFSAVNQEFDSFKTSCELSWSPGIFQLKTRWAYTAFEAKDDLWESSFSAAVRFKHGRFSVKAASPDFPEKWNCTLSWRIEY